MYGIRRNPFKADAAFHIYGSKYAKKSSLNIRDELYTWDEVMEILGVTPEHLHEMIDAKVIPHIVFGGVYFFPVQDIDRMPKSAKEKIESGSPLALYWVAEIGRLDREGLSPAGIAQQLDIDVSEVKKILLGIRRPISRIAKAKRGRPKKKASAAVEVKPKRRGRPPRQKLEKISLDIVDQALARAKEFEKKEAEKIRHGRDITEDRLMDVKHYYLKGYKKSKIEELTGLDSDVVGFVIRKFGSKYANVVYPDKLEPELKYILDALFTDMESPKTIMEIYGVSERELALFLLYNKDKWPRKLSKNATPPFLLSIAAMGAGLLILWSALRYYRSM